MTTSHFTIPEMVLGATCKQATFAASLTYERLPAEVVAKAKTCLLDTLCCCLFGATLPTVRKVPTMATEEGADGGAVDAGL